MKRAVDLNEGKRVERVLVDCRRRRKSRYTNTAYMATGFCHIGSITIYFEASVAYFL